MLIIMGFCGDVANFTTIGHVIEHFKPDVIINTTAYTVEKS